MAIIESVRLGWNRRKSAVPLEDGEQAVPHWRIRAAEGSQEGRQVPVQKSSLPCLPMTSCTLDPNSRQETTFAFTFIRGESQCDEE
jgi:hypothetical protein